MAYKTWLFITLISLLLCSHSFTQAAAPAPHLTAPEIIDVGQVQQSKTTDLKLTLGNTGEETLEIKSITTDCPCTSLYIKNGDEYQSIEPQMKLAIAPQKQLAIKIVFDSNKTKYVGPIKKFIVIESNDPERPVVRIRLSGEIVKS